MPGQKKSTSRHTKMPARQASPPRDHRVLHNVLKPTQTPAEGAAVMAVEGIGMNALVTNSFSSKLGAVDVTELMARLTATAQSVATGTREGLETMLAAQCVALNAMFTDLALRAQLNYQNGEIFERLMRLGLKAQSQSRATAESLALMQSPPTVFARQANISNGHQQVNNGIPQADRVARAEKLDSLPNELLEAHGERLDGGATGTASKRDQALAAVEKVNRPSKRRR